MGDVGGVVEISRWYEPPVTHTKCGEPRKGDGMASHDFPLPLPGLAFTTHDEPVACTTG